MCEIEVEKLFEGMELQETIHYMKINPEFFEAVRDGKKRFEVRRLDRNYKIGDRLLLMECVPLSSHCTGREFLTEPLKYILEDFPAGLQPGYGVLSW